MFALDVSGTVSVTSVVVAGIVSVLGVVGFQNRRARTAAIRGAFNDVVGSLASTENERQLAGAILLRRFFDEKSELGMRDLVRRRRAPYAAEACSVLAAVLRGLPSGDLQKLLADGLAFAPTLASADLQRANLQDAYLSPRRVEGSLAKADFYRADLSGASLKNASARGAVFYQARARDTIFRGADLCDANFFEADLAGARFDGARLLGASFAQAINVPIDLTPHIGADGVYTSAEPVVRAEVARRPVPPRVFVTPWTHLEAGMAHGLGLPLLLVREEGVSAGAFANDVAGHHAQTISLPASWDDSTVEQVVAAWARDLSD